MKRLLPLVLIAFLISCNNQQTDTNGSENKGLTTEEKEAVDKSGENTEMMHPNEVAQESPSDYAERERPKDKETSVIFQKGTTAYENGDFAQGVKYFIQVLQKYPDDRRSYYNLGLGYFKLNNFKEALSAFNNAIKIMPNDSLSYQYRGRVYYMMGNYRECLKDYNKALELTPTNPIAYYNTGTAKGRLKDYLGAIKDFDKAIELNPEYGDAYYNRGLANYYQGRLHDACYDWQMAHNLGHFEAEKALRAYCEE